MSTKIYHEIEIENYNLKLSKFNKDHEKNRKNLRKLVIRQFIKEKAGQGKKEKTSRYKYFVEELCSGNRIYLTRPAYFNKGFDFVIHIENYKFSNKKDYPKYKDIKKDLRKKKRNNIRSYYKLLEAIKEVFECKDPNDIYHKYRKRLEIPNFGLPSELILKVIKWLFIEQDITYWNWSGRNMFMQGVNNI
jgi:hypothetical protein